MTHSTTEALCAACGAIYVTLPLSVGLAVGDCGFSPSRCTVECDLGQVVHTHCLWHQAEYNLIQCKLGE